MTYREHKQVKWKTSESGKILEHLISNYGESFYFNIVDSNESDPKDVSRLKILTENRQTNEIIQFELAWLDITIFLNSNVFRNELAKSVLEMITILQSRCRDNKINTILNERSNG